MVSDLSIGEGDVEANVIVFLSVMVCVCWHAPACQSVCVCVCLYA